MAEETLGERIKRLRETRRWTQQDLADQLGVVTKTVSNWERDRNDPRSSIGALREVFGRAFDADLASDDEGDPVEAAVRASALHAWRQGAVISEYQRHMHEQRREATG